MQCYCNTDGQNCTLARPSAARSFTHVTYSFASRFDFKAFVGQSELSCPTSATASSQTKWTNVKMDSCKDISLHEYCSLNWPLRLHPCSTRNLRIYPEDFPLPTSGRPNRIVVRRFVGFLAPDQLELHYCFEQIICFHAADKTHSTVNSAAYAYND